MKQGTLVFMILLLAIAYSYASSNPAEEADHWEKVRQMDQLAERFKAETGFTGRISNDTNRMCLGYYEGKFTDIHITAESDTASFRSVFDHILDKVLPYTYAKREHLSKSRITNNLGRIKTEYFQQINGYRVEGAGRISIVYETGRYGFAIGNGTVELPDEDTLEIISRTDVEQIALSYMNNDNYNTAECVNLYYSREGADRYYLAYLVNVTSDKSTLYEDTIFWIDAISGEIKHYIVNPSI